jgi:hypothetical protein
MDLSLGAGGPFPGRHRQPGPGPCETLGLRRRSHPAPSNSALNGWCEQLGYVPVPFTATMDGTLSGQPIYHTNVVMSIGLHFAVVCFDAVPYPAERQELREELAKAGKAIIPITLEQMHRYVGQHARAAADGRDVNPLLSDTAFHALRSRCSASPVGAARAVGPGGHPHHRGRGRWQRAVHVGGGVPTQRHSSLSPSFAAQTMFQDRLQAQLVPALQSAFKQLFTMSSTCEVSASKPTRPEFEGDVTINVFPFLKISGKGPEQTGHGHRRVPATPGAHRGALQCGQGLPQHRDRRQLLDGLPARGRATRISSPSPATGRKVMVEYASAQHQQAPAPGPPAQHLPRAWSVSRILKRPATRW